MDRAEGTMPPSLWPLLRLATVVFAIAATANTEEVDKADDAEDDGGLPDQNSAWT